MCLTIFGSAFMRLLARIRSNSRSLLQNSPAGCRRVASWRRPGFVQVIGENAIRIPDYAGNNLFNTLGNFHVYPHAGLLVPDFASGRLLQLIGRPAIEWSREPVGQGAGGTNRCWTLRIARWRITTPPAYLKHRFIDHSPYLLGDGTTTNQKQDREDPIRP